MTFRPASRNSDPGTSHAAERFHTNNGSREAHTRLVARIVSEHPGLTMREVAEHMIGVKDAVEEAHRRLYDATERGWVTKGQQVTRNGNRPAATYWPCAKQEERLRLL